MPQLFFNSYRHLEGKSNMNEVEEVIRYAKRY